MKDHSRCKLLLLPLLVLSMAWSSGLLAQAADAAGAQQPRKIGVILKDIKKVETAVNKTFNALNSSNEFDLVCYSFTATGSKMRQRVCEPKFMKDARKREAERFVAGTRQGTDTTVPQTEGVLPNLVQDEIVELQRELQAITRSSPEFAAQLATLQELVKEYSAHERARDNDPALGFLSRFMQRSSLN